MVQMRVYFLMPEGTALGSRSVPLSQHLLDGEVEGLAGEVGANGSLMPWKQPQRGT